MDAVMEDTRLFDTLRRHDGFKFSRLIWEDILKSYNYPITLVAIPDNQINLWITKERHKQSIAKGVQTLDDIRGNTDPQIYTALYQIIMLYTMHGVFNIKDELEQNDSKIIKPQSSHPIKISRLNDSLAIDGNKVNFTELIIDNNVVRGVIYFLNSFDFQNT